MWLKDLLPQELPNARIMTFGYAATVLGNTSTAGVRDNARSLTQLLQDEREDNVCHTVTNSARWVFVSQADRIQEDEHRPIVFVGHSLGGIIIKQVCSSTLQWRDLGPESH